MKKFSKIIRRTFLVFFICLAALLSVPITFYSRDKESKFVLEQVDEKEEEEDEKDVKELF